MKNKSFLLILELLCMVLFFSLIAAITLRGFSSAREISDRKNVLESAIVVTQNTAEVLKSTGGDFVCAAEKLSGGLEAGRLVLDCDRSGQPIQVDGSEVYFSVIAEQIPTENPLLGSAHISAVFAGEIILEFDVCWQRSD